MTTFLPALGVLLVLAVGTTMTGRLLAGVFNIRLLRRLTPESLAVSAFLGTGTWALGFGWCSYAHLTGKQALPVMGGAAALLLVTLIAQRRLNWLVPPTHLKVWLLVSAIFFLGALINMLPLLLGDSFNPYNDCFYYISNAEYLREHSFGIPCLPDPSQPIHAMVTGCQQMGHHMGAMFLLGLVKCLFPFFLSLDLFPVVMTWGVILNLGGVLVLCRWTLRLSPGYAAAVVCLTAVTVNPLWLSASYGFFSQVHGTAALSFALALVSRLYAPINWRFGCAFLFGMTGAILLTMYSELTLILAMGRPGLFHPECVASAMGGPPDSLPALCWDYLAGARFAGQHRIRSRLSFVTHDLARSRCGVASPVVNPDLLGLRHGSQTL